MADYLARPCRSGKPAVWVDCRLLDTLSISAMWLLGACHRRLLRRGVPLVLCQVPESVVLALRQTLAGAACGLRLVASLDEAAGPTTGLGY